MLPGEIQGSALWKRTLSPDINDDFRVERAKLVAALDAMRSSVIGIVGEIAASCPGLTIHDATHLDALWETADEVIGADYPVNPVEAFVFGATVLLHDAALALVAYPGGESALRATLEWQDMESAMRRMRAPTARKVPLSKREVEQLTFAVLRRLHAAQAEKLALQAWSLQNGAVAYLLGDSELRQAYGESIGRIAHSHHWSIERVSDDMRVGLGASPALPSIWTLNELKVACMLRCADVSHIDRRRAPTILMSGKRLDEESARHWIFQNKLNRPTLRDGALVFASGEAFSLEQAPAWWLCYQTIKMVDSEIRSSNSVLAEKGIDQFTARRVAGAETPRSLSRYITTSGWKPVDTDIRVSDPASLARALGGANLYGNDKLAPMRELLQNGVDAVRARRKIEGRPHDWGFVRVTLEESAIPGKAWLNVDDTGIGMSERILTKSLLDFGTSSWQSPMLQEEFPGLESKGIDPIGKFGIGFFSVFLLGDIVEVTTKKFRGSDHVKVLSFSGIETKPILRDGADDDLPLDCSTRVRVLVDDPGAFSREIDLRESSALRRNEKLEPVRALEILVSACDVNIIYDDLVHGKHFQHSGNWLDSSPESFLRSIAIHGGSGWPEESLVETHAHLVRPLADENGKIYGRAALNVAPTYYSRDNSRMSRVSVGGFLLETDARGREPDYYFGVLEGETRVASRASASANVPSTVMKAWASDQARLIEVAKLHPHDLLPVCHNVLRLGGDSRELPFGLVGKRLVSFSEFREWAAGRSQVHLPVSLTYSGYSHVDDERRELKYIGLNQVARDVLFFGMKPDYFCAVGSDANVVAREYEGELLDDTQSNAGEMEVDRNNLLRGPFNIMTTIIGALKNVWRSELSFTIRSEKYLEAESYRREQSTWALSLKRAF